MNRYKIFKKYVEQFENSKVYKENVEYLETIKYDLENMYCYKYPHGNKVAFRISAHEFQPDFMIVQSFEVDVHFSFSDENYEKAYNYFCESLEHVKLLSSMTSKALLKHYSDIFESSNYYVNNKKLVSTLLDETEVTYRFVLPEEYIIDFKIDCTNREDPYISVSQSNKKTQMKLSNNGYRVVYKTFCDVIDSFLSENEVNDIALFQEYVLRFENSKLYKENVSFITKKSSILDDTYCFNFSLYSNLEFKIDFKEKHKHHFNIYEPNIDDICFNLTDEGYEKMYDKAYQYLEELIGNLKSFYDSDILIEKYSSLFKNMDFYKENSNSIECYVINHIYVFEFSFITKKIYFKIDCYGKYTPSFWVKDDKGQEKEFELSDEGFKGAYQFFCETSYH